MDPDAGKRHNEQTVQVLRWRKKDAGEVPPPSTRGEANSENWLLEGTAIVHATFGTGRVVRVGPHHGAQVAWVDFDRGDRKMLDPSYASAHVRLQSVAATDRGPDPGIKCDVCGDRPVVVTIAGADGTQQFCGLHKTSFGP
jgi:hypothetical protein